MPASTSHPIVLGFMRKSMRQNPPGRFCLLPPHPPSPRQIATDSCDRLVLFAVPWQETQPRDRLGPIRGKKQCSVTVKSAEWALFCQSRRSLTAYFAICRSRARDPCQCTCENGHRPAILGNPLRSLTPWHIRPGFRFLVFTLNSNNLL